MTERAADWWNPITEDLVDLTSFAGGDRYQFGNRQSPSGRDYRSKRFSGEPPSAARGVECGAQALVLSGAIGECCSHGKK